MAAATGLIVAIPLLLPAESLRGSRASLDRQNRVARQHDYTYLDTPMQVRHFARKGWLVRVRPNQNFRLKGVSFPYARPEVRTFIRRLSAQYRAACGERLVVTSLTRPTTRQPRNASVRSVHPTGMALDLRYSRNRRCRNWLERVLLSLEKQGVLEATRERRPVHYHVALFPQQYVAYVGGLRDTLDVADVPIPREKPVVPTLADAVASSRSSSSAEAALEGDAPAASEPVQVAQADLELSPDTEESARVGRALQYQVRRGDSLWTIARSHGVSVSDLRQMNDLRGSRIRVGQTLQVGWETPPAPEPELATQSVAQAQPAVQQEPATQPVAYTVRNGDSLWGIARSYGVSVQELRRVNALRGNRIRAGQTLQVRAGGDLMDQRAAAYTVRRGDSLWTIARSYGMTVRELRRANGLRSSRIRAGQVLEIPLGS